MPRPHDHHTDVQEYLPGVNVMLERGGLSTSNARGGAADILKVGPIFTISRLPNAVLQCTPEVHAHHIDVDGRLPGVNMTLQMCGPSVSE